MAPMAPNKNEQPFCKNMDATIGATSPQLPKYDVGAITFAETRFIPPLEMGREEAC